jgi:hypothetical protein
MLAPSSTTSLTWPVPGDAPDLKQIIADQAATMAANAALLTAYQDWLDTFTNPPPGTATTATATATGTTLAISAPSGPPIETGSTITDGALVPDGTVILGQISGTAGGAGNYLTNNPTTVADTPITITPPPPASAWPNVSDAPTLMVVTQDQLTILRQQNAMLQAYQTLFNVTGTPAPPTGP